jgi:hypothetical protein
MRTRLVILSLLACLATPSGPAAAADPVTAWPATRVGEAAKGWITAFNAGEDAMREFLATRMAARALGERAVPARVERYRELREEYGRLQLDKVVQSAPYELTARLLDADAKPREFVFKSEARAPWKLVSVAIKEQGFHGFNLPGHGH